MLIRISEGWGSPEGGLVPPFGAATGASTLRDAAADLPIEVTVRAARIGDMRAVEALVNRFAADNLMLPKSFDQLARNFREFVVAVDGVDRVVGCGALRIYTEELAEVCSLAVHEPLQRAGVGRRVVEQLIEDARGLGVHTVFALTLRPDFFDRLGFRVVAKEDFPLKVWADCRNCPKLHACDEIAVAIEVGGQPRC